MRSKNKKIALFISLILHMFLFCFIYQFTILQPNENIEIKLIPALTAPQAYESTPPTNLENENILPNAYEKIKHPNKQVTIPQAASAKIAAPIANPPIKPAPAITTLSASVEVKPRKPISFTSEALGLKVTYPRLSRILAEEGEVILTIKTSSTGKIEKIKVLKSSGYLRLDEAAIETLRKKQSLILSENSELKISFLFKLK